MFCGSKEYFVSIYTVGIMVFLFVFYKIQNIVSARFLFCNTGLLMRRMEFFGGGGMGLTFYIIGVQSQHSLSPKLISDILGYVLVWGFFLMKVQVIYSVVLVSSVHQSQFYIYLNTNIYVCMCVFFCRLFSLVDYQKILSVVWKT